MVCFQVDRERQCDPTDMSDDPNMTSWPTLDVLFEGDTGAGYLFASVSLKEWQEIVARVEDGQPGRVITWHQEPDVDGTFDFRAIFTPSEMTGLFREVLTGIVSRNNPALTIAQAIELATAIVT